MSCITQETKEPEVKSALNRLATEIAATMESAKNLHARLTSVLRPLDEGNKAEIEPRQKGVALAEAIRSMEDQVRDIQAMINDANKRLEI
jgi:uncharacterized coiled-coil DUF342 family protein